MRKFEKGFKLPFKIMSIGSHVWDANGEMVAMVADIDKEIRQDVIDIINGDTESNVDNQITYDRPNGFITVNGANYILIRGWGHLTGQGGLRLSDEEAIEIQDDLANYIVERLTYKP